jgi:hypothetical protein
MSDEQLFTREEVLGGLPDRRARRVLTAIESLCARRSATETRAGAYLGVSDAAMVGEAALWTALLAASESEAQTQAEDDGLDEIRMLAGRTRRPDSIRQIERNADLWAPLVPAGADLRAALIRQLGSRYRFERRHVPGIRAALGLDTEEVQAAYARRYKEPLDQVYQPEVSVGERLRWGWTALEKGLDRMPPFWFAFAFTLTETIGAAVLALPITLARLGPLGALAALILVGLANVLTIAAMAEALTRSGVIRQGSSFIGKVARDLLGPAASGAVSLALLLFSFLALILFYVGFGDALAGCIGGPTWLWAAALLGVSLVLLARDSVRGTIASALVVGAINIVLILGLALAAVFHAPAVVTSAPAAFSLHGVAVALAAVLTAYMGHTSVGNVARIVLRRDPSGRSLLAGCAAAMAAAIGIYSLFTLALLHAVPTEQLAAASGTALEPLRRVSGEGVAIAAGLYATLAMGMGAQHQALALFNLVRERLPANARLIAELPADGGRMVLEHPSRPDAAPRIGVAYLGLRSGRPRYRTEVLADGSWYSAESDLAGRWRGQELVSLAPSLKDRLPMALTVLEADASGSRLLVEGSLRPRYEGAAAGTPLSGMLVLGDGDWTLVRAALVQGEITPEDASAALSPELRDSVWERLEGLVRRGLLRKVDAGEPPRYAAALVRSTRRQVPNAIWEAMDLKAASPPPEPSPEAAAPVDPPTGALTGLLGREPWRSVAAYSPVLAAFLVAEGLLLTKTGSFAGLVGFMGVVLGPFLTGILPILLVVAARRRGELLPGSAWRPLANPAVAVTLGLAYYLSLPFYALHAGRRPLELVGALILAVALPVLIGSLFRGGAFRRRAVVELREDGRPGGVSEVRTLVGGDPTPALVRLDPGDAAGETRSEVVPIVDPARLRSAEVELPPSCAPELRVWARHIGPDGGSEPLLGIAEVESGGGVQRFDLGLSEGFVSVALNGGPTRVRIEPARASGRAPAAATTE